MKLPAANILEAIEQFFENSTPTTKEREELIDLHKLVKLHLHSRPDFEDFEVTNQQALILYNYL